MNDSLESVLPEQKRSARVRELEEKIKKLESENKKLLNKVHTSTPSPERHCSDKTIYNGCSYVSSLDDDELENGLLDVKALLNEDGGFKEDEWLYVSPKLPPTPVQKKITPRQWLSEGHDEKGKRSKDLPSLDDVRKSLIFDIDEAENLSNLSNYSPASSSKKRQLTANKSSQRYTDRRLRQERYSHQEVNSELNENREPIPSATVPTDSQASLSDHSEEDLLPSRKWKVKQVPSTSAGRASELLNNLPADMGAAFERVGGQDAEDIPIVKWKANVPPDDEPPSDVPVVKWEARLRQGNDSSSDVKWKAKMPSDSSDVPIVRRRATMPEDNSDVPVVKWKARIPDDTSDVPVVRRKAKMPDSDVPVVKWKAKMPDDINSDVPVVRRKAKMLDSDVPVVKWKAKMPDDMSDINSDVPVVKWKAKIPDDVPVIRRKPKMPDSDVPVVKWKAKIPDGMSDVPVVRRKAKMPEDTLSSDVLVVKRKAKMPELPSGSESSAVKWKAKMPEDAHVVRSRMPEGTQQKSDVPVVRRRAKVPEDNQGSDVPVVKWKAKVPEDGFDVPVVKLKAKVPEYGFDVPVAKLKAKVPEDGFDVPVVKLKAKVPENGSGVPENNTTSTLENLKPQEQQHSLHSPRSQKKVAKASAPPGDLIINTEPVQFPDDRSLQTLQHPSHQTTSASTPPLSPVTSPSHQTQSEKWPTKPLSRRSSFCESRSPSPPSISPQVRMAIASPVLSRRTPSPSRTLAGSLGSLNTRQSPSSSPVIQARYISGAGGQQSPGTSRSFTGIPSPGSGGHVSRIRTPRTQSSGLVKPSSPLKGLTPPGQRKNRRMLPSPPSPEVTGQPKGQSKQYTPTPATKEAAQKFPAQNTGDDDDSWLEGCF